MDRLTTLGWLEAPKSLSGEARPSPSDEEIRKALMAYQGFFNLGSRDGYPDAEVLRSLNEPRFCSMEDVAPMTAAMGRWAFKDIGYFLNFSDFPRLGMARAVEAFAEGFKMWTDVADLNIFRVTDRSKAAIVISLGRGDGPFNVLAFSQVPGEGNRQQLTQEFDSKEAWSAGADVPQNQIDLVRVVGHEGAHALGVMHISMGNLLAPTYDRNIRLPQQGDLQEIRARYGARVKPIPVPDNPPSGATTIIIEGPVSNITIPGWKVTRSS